jgi:hypothetical protein
MRAGEFADLRIVAVDGECRPSRERANRLAPPLREDLELAVAVELVAKQVAEAECPRPDPPRDLRKRGLVDLEEPELRV